MLHGFSSEAFVVRNDDPEITVRQALELLVDNVLHNSAGFPGLTSARGKVPLSLLALLDDEGTNVLEQSFDGASPSVLFRSPASSPGEGTAAAIMQAYAARVAAAPCAPGATAVVGIAATAGDATAQVEPVEPPTPTTPPSCISM